MTMLGIGAALVLIAASVLAKDQNRIDMDNDANSVEAVNEPAIEIWQECVKDAIKNDPKLSKEEQDELEELADAIGVGGCSVHYRWVWVSTWPETRVAICFRQKDKQSDACLYVRDGEETGEFKEVVPEGART
jgi:hypothetical protein